MHHSPDFFNSVDSLKRREEDIEYAIKYGRFVLRSIGIWPDTGNKIRKYLSNFAILTGNLALSFAIVPCALHIIYEEKDINLKLKLFGLLSFCICVIIKYFALSIRRSDIDRCIEWLKTDWYQVCVSIILIHLFDQKCNKSSYFLIKKCCHFFIFFNHQTIA